MGKEKEMRKTAKHKGFRKFPKRRKRINNVSVKKRVYERARSKTRIYIGVAFERWRHLRQLKGMKTDAELALFLLDGLTPENTDEGTINADEFASAIVDFEDPKCRDDEECLTPLEKGCPDTG